MSKRHLEGADDYEQPAYATPQSDGSFDDNPPEADSTQQQQQQQSERSEEQSADPLQPVADTDEAGHTSKRRRTCGSIRMHVVSSSEQSAGVDSSAASPAASQPAPAGASSAPSADSPSRAATAAGATSSSSHSAPAPAPVSESVEVRCVIESSHAGALIGKGGVNITRVRQTSGAQATILKNDAHPHAAERVLQVRGTPEQVIAAGRVVIDILQKEVVQPRMTQQGHADGSSSDPAASSGGTVVLTLLVHRVQVGAIIGTGGSLIKEMIATTGARVHISPETLGPHSTEKSVQLSGTDTQVHAAFVKIVHQMHVNPIKPTTKVVPFVPGSGGSALQHEPRLANGGGSHPPPAPGGYRSQQPQQMYQAPPSQGPPQPLLQHFGVAPSGSLLQSQQQQSGQAVPAAFAGYAPPPVPAATSASSTPAAFAGFMPPPPPPSQQHAAHQQQTHQQNSQQQQQQQQQHQLGSDPHALMQMQQQSLAMGHQPQPYSVSYEQYVQHMQHHMQQMHHQGMAMQQGMGQPPYGGYAPSYRAPRDRSLDPTCSTQRIAIPTVCSGVVIGHKGDIVRRLALTSGAKISLAPPEATNPTERVVSIMGTPAEIQSAIQLIQAQVESFTPGQRPPPPTAF